MGNKMITPSLPLPETSYRLSEELGLLRSWTHFLTDNIRGRQHVAGFTLLPCAYVHDGKSYRPFYAVEDIETFIKNVSVAIPGVCKSVAVPMMLEIDIGRSWRLNLFANDGKPIVRPKTVTHRKPAKKPASIRMKRRGLRSVTLLCGRAQKMRS